MQHTTVDYLPHRLLFLLLEWTELEWTEHDAAGGERQEENRMAEKL